MGDSASNPPSDGNPGSQAGFWIGFPGGIDAMPIGLAVALVEDDG